MHFGKTWARRAVAGSAGLGLWLALGLAGAAMAEDSWGYDIAHELMSPYCPGRTLATCPSPQAAELVQWIVMQEAAGATQEEVVEMLVERFGDDILGAPKAEGITLWAYVLPVAGFLGGGVAVFLVLRRIVGGARGGRLAAAGLGGDSIAVAPPGSPNLSAVPEAKPPVEGPPSEGATLDGPRRAGSPLSTPPLSAPPKDEDDDLARIVDGDLDLRA